MILSLHLPPSPLLPCSSLLLPSLLPPLLPPLPPLLPPLILLSLSPSQETTLYGCTVRINEPVGVIWIACPDESPLLAFVSLFAPAVVRGNTIIIVPSEKYPLSATDLYQVNGREGGGVCWQRVGGEGGGEAEAGRRRVSHLFDASAVSDELGRLFPAHS